MRLGRYADGRDLTYDESGGRFAVGGTPISLEQVLEYDAFAQIEWLSDEIHAWVQGIQANVTGGVRPDSGRSWPLLGFRSRRLWKMAVASVYYASWAVFALAAVASQSPHVVDTRDRALDVVTGLILALVALSPAIFLSDFAYRQRVPLFKHRKVLWNAAGFGVVFLLSFVAIGLADSMHSQPYKLAVEADRLEERERREVERVAREEREAAERDAEQEQKKKARLAEHEERDRADQPAQSAERADPDQVVYDLGDMADPVLIQNFVAACDAIGIDPHGIKKVSQLPDWASGERYDFSYESSRLRVCANADRSISSINLGQMHLYEQGYEPLQIDDYLVDWGTALELQVRAEETVKGGLNYPSTADFSWFEGWGVGRRQDIYFIGGTVSAKNAFGVAKDATFYIEYQKSGDSYSARYFVLDGANVIGSKSVIVPVARKEVGTASTDDMIVLLEGTIGSYGESKHIDGDEYIWYYVPPGRYTVTSQTNTTKLYLDKNTTITNSDGWSECVNVTTLDFTDSSEPRELVVSQDQHIELTARAKVTLVPIR